MDEERSEGNRSPPFRYTARVSRAAGMIAMQVGCDVEQALDLIYERAEASRVTVDELATAVIDGSVRFDR